MIGKKKVEAGAPAWVLTYGDMMSLLLCFFILLAAFADYEKGGSAAIMEAMQSIQQALGIQLPSAKTSAKSFDFNAFVDQLKKTIQDFEAKNRGDSQEKGIYGKTFRLRRIRDGMEITVGGPILFEPFSANLTEQGKESLAQIGENLRGHRNKVDIIGHAAEEPRPKDWTYLDAMELSYQRATKVAEELIHQGADPRTLRLVAVGANEPLPADGAESNRASDSRRVEIVIRESMIDDYAGEIPARTPQKPDSGNAPTSQPAATATP